jgi:hypothetical protein
MIQIFAWTSAEPITIPHVAVTHDLAACHDAPIGGHDACVGLDAICEPLEPAHAAEGCQLHLWKTQEIPVGVPPKTPSRLITQDDNVYVRTGSLQDADQLGLLG